MKTLRIASSAFVLVLIAACGNEQPAPAVPVTAQLSAAVVESREVDLDYSAEAVVEAVRQSTVAAQIAGRVVELRFDVGDAVKKGEVIVRIDERAATQAVAASAAQVQEAQASLANSRAQFERSKQLAAQKFISAAGLEKAEAEYKAAPGMAIEVLYLRNLLANMGFPEQPNTPVYEDNIAWSSTRKRLIDCLISA